MTQKTLTEALAALTSVIKGDNVVTMNAEQLTAYAAEQIQKMAGTTDETPRKLHLKQTVAAALDVFKADPTAAFEFQPYVEAVAPSATATLDESIAKLNAVVDKLVTKELASAIADAPAEVAAASTTTVHPPPVPPGHGATPEAVGSAVSTNLPQGDDGTVNPDHLRKDAQAATGGVEVEHGDEDEVEDDMIWPNDLNTSNFMKGIVSKDGNRPKWGFDHEAIPLTP